MALQASRFAALRRAPATTGQTGAKPAQAAAPVVLLDVPFTYRAAASAAGAVWDARLASWRTKNAHIPPELEPFRSKPYSYERLREDEENHHLPLPSKPTRQIVLRPHQVEAARAIANSKRRGRVGFLLADEVGLGKTLSAWQGVLDMPEVRSVLVVTTLAAVAHWRQSISWLGDGGKSVAVVNYDRLAKLVPVPEDAKGKKPKTLKGKAQRGVARQFDVIIWDESHRLKNPDAARTKLAVKLNAAADFMLWLSATAGQDPLSISYLAPLLAQLTGDRVSNLREFEVWCQAKGFGVSRQKFGKWVWDGKPEDIARAERLLFGGPFPGGIRRRPEQIAGWPELNHILLPIELTGEDAVLYQAAWSEFRQELGLGGRARDAKNVLVQRLRFRQKSSLLRIPGTIDLACDLRDNGHQVAISVAFKETLHTLLAALEAAGHACGQIHGEQNAAEKERQRLAFQHGEVPVILFTPTEAISLHQGEHNDVPRSMIVHDLRWSGIDMVQVEGRCHRDGKFAQVYWALASGAIDQTIAETVIGRIRSMKALNGDDISTIDAIQAALSAL